MHTRCGCSIPYILTSQYFALTTHTTHTGTGIGLTDVHSFMDATLDPDNNNLSMTERGTDVSYDLHGRLTRATEASTDGRPERSVSFAAHATCNTHSFSTHSNTHSMHSNVHVHDVSNPLSAHLANLDRTSELPRDSDVYSAFGGDRPYSQEMGFDNYRDSRMSSVSGVDNFFSASALQRAVSPSTDSTKNSNNV